MEKLNILSLLILFLFLGTEFATISIDSCQSLTSTGEHYQLTKDINGNLLTCINISANNITLDCQNHQIIGTGETYSRGVYNEGYDNVKIKNCIISKFDYGIYFKSGASNGEITQNTIYENNDDGILLEFNCTGNKIMNNNVYDNGVGIVLMHNSANNIIQGNTAHGNGDSGIYLNENSNNLIQDNKANENEFGIYLDFQSNDNTITGNTADNNNQAGFVFLNSSNNKVNNNYARKNKEVGVSIEWGSKKNKLSNNDFSSNANYGVFFQESSYNNELVNNNIQNNAVDIYFNTGCSGNSGTNVCDTIKDDDGNNPLTCSGSKGTTNGQSGLNNEDQTSSQDNDYEIPIKRKKGSLCYPSLIALFAIGISFLYTKE